MSDGPKIRCHVIVDTDRGIWHIERAREGQPYFEMLESEFLAVLHHKNEDADWYDFARSMLIEQNKQTGGKQ